MAEKYQSRVNELIYIDRTRPGRVILPKGMEAATKIWGQFEKARYAFERVGDQEAEEADGEWGIWRRVNGEYELAIRGSGRKNELAGRSIVFLEFE